MIKHQILILLAVIAFAIWIVYKLRDNKKNKENNNQ